MKIIERLYREPNLKHIVEKHNNCIIHCCTSFDKEDINPLISIEIETKERKSISKTNLVISFNIIV